MVGRVRSSVDVSADWLFYYISMLVSPPTHSHQIEIEQMYFILGHPCPNGTELSPKNKTRESDKKQAEHEDRQGYEAPEEGAGSDFTVSDCGDRCIDGRVLVSSCLISKDSEVADTY